MINFDPRKKDDERLEILGYLTRPKRRCTGSPAWFLPTLDHGEEIKFMVKSDEDYDFDDLANPFTVSVLVLF